MGNNENKVSKKVEREDSLQESSSKNIDTNNTDDRKKYKDIFSKLSTIDDNYTESVSEGFKPFRGKNYEEHFEEPEDFQILEDGTLVPEPSVQDTWACKYYYSPGYKAHLFRMIFILMLIMFMLVTFLFTSSLYFEVGFALFVISVLLVNVVFRYYDLAIYNRPMPMIPVVSIFFYKFFTNEYELQKDNDEDNIEDDDEYTGYIVHNNTIDPVENVKNGNPSPATILTRWMNSDDVRWRAEDLIENSGGIIDTFTLKMLLKDNEDAWTDEDIVDNISIITGSNPMQWNDAYRKWKDS